MHALNRLVPIVLLSLSLLAGCASTAPTAGDAAPEARGVPSAPIVDSGTLEGAIYRIDIPVDWNGELVVNAHGYEVAGDPRRMPMAVPRGMAPLLARGFAVASSAYSAQGWAVEEAIADTERVRQHFVARHGQPKRTWLVGWSMGGLVALASAERHPRAWDGVVAMCGVATSSETLMTRGVLAPVAAFDALYPGVLPQAAAGLADPTLPREADGDAIAAAFASDARKADAFARHFDIAGDGAAESVWLYYAVLRELVQRAGGFPVTTAAGRDGVAGDEAALGVTIRRYAADPAAQAYLHRTGALRGTAPVPIVLQPNAVDPIVPARFSHAYVAMAEAEGHAASVHVLTPVGSGHCRFPSDTVVTALDALRMR